ncbi:cytosine/purines uracil thiamine allantoin permease [Pseudomonas saudimassiliensis]|uniref:Cytosine/purines uracil thiamine allantoin permease n=1 Tax=Pseudomonas saudimassiliensis TaxID=1461581 RepID=A0A078MMG6_9PSED|nr:NCS1 family nucleobase:cation symporter-1 [Pseudomonas saudimassiliensis]CEA06602.1 cytosine/purines uracil thiamine allantoin permease [Pseudomonas saudimassiliensis]CEF27997.1 cytosine/purines uracil thiamine allantoin permease [Pseudomonas saudimassiliensis]
MQTQADSLLYDAAVSTTPSADLWNEDLAPAKAEDRTWSWQSISGLWVGMVVCVPTYMMAAGLVAEGMSWWQAVLTVLAGNIIVLIPMIAIGHAGTKHGIPFPVLLRSSFGTAGAKLPAMLRGLVACGWFGIQTWVGGSAIYIIINIMTDNAISGSLISFLGIDLGQLVCFLLFWALHVFFIARGTESIRWLETYAAPFLIAMGLALLGWAYFKAGGFGSMLSTPSQFVAGGPREGQFWSVFWPGLTAMVGYWATMALNIPDFTRFARSQKDQFIGQALGLPLPMALFAFIGVAVTSATVVIYGKAIWDPVELTSHMGGFAVIVALIALILATLTTNLAANVVAPANGFSNLSPSKISFKMGGYLTAGLGIAIMPWKLLESTSAYIFTWLIGYSALLGPVAGIMVADYFVIRKTRLNHRDLFRNDGEYSYRKGWNPVALIALVIGILPNLPGFLHVAGFIDTVPSVFQQIYTYAWFVGLIIASSIYLILMRNSLKKPA